MNGIPETGTKPATSVSAETLKAAGYREYPGNFGERRILQRTFDDDDGRKFFLTFREWQHPGHAISYDAEVATKTATGSVWITIKEATIERTEEVAQTLWTAAGGVYYERNDGSRSDET